MPYQLTKGEKKLAREIIEKGVQSEFKATLEAAKKVVEEWGSGKIDNRDGYHKLYKTVIEQNKLIAKRYDGVRGSDYLMTVAVILFDKQITEEEISDFSDEAKQDILSWIRLWKQLVKEGI